MPRLWPEVLANVVLVVVKNAFVDEANKVMTINGMTFTNDSYLSLDGTTGNVYEGTLATTDFKLSDNFFNNAKNGLKSIKNLELELMLI